jgi:hypothetical protein
MEERLTHGGAGGEARGADHAQGVPAQWAPPILLVETSLPVPMSLTVPHVSGPGCPPKRPRYPALGSMRRLAGLLALSTVTCAPVEPRSGPPVAETDPATLADYGRCDESRADGPLDLTGAVLTFADEFHRPSITGPDGDGPWFAPIHGGFGSAEFLPPHSTEPPFYFDNGVLTIPLAKRYRRWTLYLDDGSLRLAKRDGRWTSGILQSVNADGEGFTQRYCYFEMRAKFPKGNGTWPAFWLKTVNQFTDRSQTRAEIDIIEAYGGKNWSGYHAAVHLWPARNPGPEQLQKHWSQGCYERNRRRHVRRRVASLRRRGRPGVGDDVLRAPGGRTFSDSSRVSPSPFHPSRSRAEWAGTESDRGPRRHADRLHPRLAADGVEWP